MKGGLTIQDCRAAYTNAYRQVQRSRRFAGLGDFDRFHLTAEHNGDIIPLGWVSHSEPTAHIVRFRSLKHHNAHVRDWNRHKKLIAMRGKGRIEDPDDPQQSYKGKWLTS